MTHEIKQNEAYEETSRRGKSIALKSTHKRSNSSKAMKAVEESNEEEEEPSIDDDDDEKDEIAHLAEGYLRPRLEGKSRNNLSPKRTRRERPSRLKSSASNTRSMDT